MKIEIKATNLRLTKELENYINDKISGLRKFLKIFFNREKLEKRKLIGEVFVEVGKETKHHQKGQIFRAEAQLFLPQKTLRAEALREDLKMAICEVKDELQQEIKKYKAKTIASNRRRQRQIKKNFHLATQARWYRGGRIKEEGI